MTEINIYKLLDKLEMHILKGIPIPLTPWVIVNHVSIINSLDKIRNSLLKTKENTENKMDTQ